MTILLDLELLMLFNNSFDFIIVLISSSEEFGVLNDSKFGKT